MTAPRKFDPEDGQDRHEDCCGAYQKQALALEVCAGLDDDEAFRNDYEENPRSRPSAFSGGKYTGCWFCISQQPWRRHAFQRNGLGIDGISYLVLYRPCGNTHRLVFCLNTKTITRKMRSRLFYDSVVTYVL